MKTMRLTDIAVPQRPDEDCWTVKMRRAMQDALTECDFSDLARTLMDRAKAGDKTALQIVLGQVLSPGPKTLVVHQHFQPRKKSAARSKKINGRGTQVAQQSLPRHDPPIEEVERQVNELRRQKGLSPATWDRG
jgi:hypothetical protein